MKKHQGRRSNQKKLKLPHKSVQYLLESGTLYDMRAAKQVTDALLRYQWDYYSELCSPKKCHSR